MLLTTLQDITKILAPQHDFLSSVTAYITIAGTIYAVVRWGVTPVVNYFVKPVWIKLANFISRANSVPDQLEKTLLILHNDVLPFITSFQAEFTRNSGKSLKDQITRIDDNVKLAELRSKLISNMLTTICSYECDPQGNTTWVNKAMCELFGLTHEEMLSNGWLSAVDEKERADIWERWHDNIRSGIPHEIEYTVHNRRKGETFKVRSNAAAHKANDGRVLGYYGNVVRLP
jgi:PAS domain S-box-containing protein